MDSLDALHFSPNCETLSLARRSRGPPHRAFELWARFQLDADFFASASQCAIDDALRPVSEQALLDDATRASVLAMCLELSYLYPSALFSVENPLALFRHMPDVRAMCRYNNWCLVSVDYCACASTKTDFFVTNKPTDLLIANVDRSRPIVGPTCRGHDCPYTLPGSSLHKFVICGSASLVPGQVALRDPLLRSAVPLGLFDFLEGLRRRSPAEPPVRGLPTFVAPDDQSDRPPSPGDVSDGARRPVPSGVDLGSLPNDPCQSQLPSLPPVPAPTRRLDLAYRALTTLPTAIQAWFAYDGLTCASIACGSYSGLVRTNALADEIRALRLPNADRLRLLEQRIAEQVGDASFVRSPTLGLGVSWAFCHFEVNDDVADLNLVTAAVHRMITLVAGTTGSPHVSYDPMPKIDKPPGWQKGQPHLPHHRREWAKLSTISNWALHHLEHYFYAVPHTRVPPQRRKNAPALRPESVHFDAEQDAFVREKLGKELDAGVQELTDDPPLVVHSVFLVPKPEGSDEKWRLIHDMSGFRKYWDRVPFRMEGIREFSSQFRPGYFYFTTDLLAGYHNFVVAPWMRTLFGLSFDGMYMRSVSAPFAFRLSSYWLHRMGRIILRHLRNKGFRGIQYLDDNIWGAPSFAEAVLLQIEVLRLYESLGLNFNKKSMLLPSLRVEWLGVIAHTAAETPTWHVPERKIKKYRDAAADLLVDTLPVPVRKLAKVIGQLVSIATAIPITRVISRELYQCLYRKRRVDWEHGITDLSSDAREELRFIVDNVIQLNHRGFPIFFSDAVEDLAQLAPHIHLHVDASYVGAGYQLRPAHEDPTPQPNISPALGFRPCVPQTGPPTDLPAFARRHSQHIPFTPTESNMAQAGRELYALALAIKSLSSLPGVRGRRVRAFVDAQSSMWLFHNGGGSNAALNKVLRLLHFQLLHAGVQLVDVAWCSGDSMVASGTDGLSRPAPNSVADRAEWHLSACAYQFAVQWAGFVPQVDLFANRANAQCQVFFATSFDPGRTGLPDAFANSWRLLDAYAFPPEPLIVRTVNYAVESRCRLLLVTPYFPGSSWWGPVMSASARWHNMGRSPSLVERLKHCSNAVQFEAVPRPFCELCLFLLLPRPDT